MSETKDTDAQDGETGGTGATRTPRASGGKLTLGRTVETGHVRQNFSHGRSKAVLVEKKRRRVAPKDKAEAPAAKKAEAAAPAAEAKPAAAKAPAPAAPAAEAPAPAAEAKPAAAKAAPAAEAKAEATPAAEPAAKPAAKTATKTAAKTTTKTAAKTATKTAAKKAAPAADAGKPARASRPERDARARGNMVLRTLTEEEKGARGRALIEAREREKLERQKAIEDAEKRKIAEEAARVAAIEEAARLAKEEEIARREAEAKAKADKAAALLAKEEAEAEGTPAQVLPGEPKPGAKAIPTPVAKKREDENKPAPKRTTGNERRRGRLTISNALDDEPRQRSLAAMRRRQQREKRARGGKQEQVKVHREVTIPDTISVQELAARMTERAVDVIKLLMAQGQMLQINDVIDADTAQLIAEEMGHTVKRVSESDVEEGLTGEVDDEADLQPRAPVVTVMGHVDHGKTSLLDALRQTDVAAGEAGGITQHIGAYQVRMPAGQRITFLDTPGHAAFTTMRARGAQATDIVVLVVAGDDGVMPQTIEAINHAKAAEVPLIIAINKMDKPDIDPNRVRTDLLQHEVIVESMSGDVQEVEVSATAKMNLDKLEEAILLQSELLELKANPDRAADGLVIEAQLDKGRGPVATVLVQRGTLRLGDVLVAGGEWGKVRALINDRGEQVSEAGPSEPVEVLGLGGTPEAGDMISVVEDESRAREITEYRQRVQRDKRAAGSARGSLEQMFTQLQESDKKEVPLVVKGDVQGSVEAIVGTLDKTGTDDIMARVLHAGVGGITESDVTLAAASGAAILGFNVRANAPARDAARQQGVDIRYYAVIYDLIDDVKAAMAGVLGPELREAFLGNAEILEVFNVSKVGKVAGCRITEGTVKRGSKVRLLRDDVVIHEGTLSTLQRFKDEVKEVGNGQECGMSFENYQDIRKGDVIECFDVTEVERVI
ncbi:translation initiation factor IF-2 [Pyruvatibacter sp.]|uniref:translation initiation factor IF-2 n=1 Tax=Pyruvatibacter sp. TaxID=1981328 RepID=UPI003267D097